MKLLRTCCIVLCLIVGLIFFTSTAFAAYGDRAGSYAPDRVIVKFKEGTSETTKQQTHARHRGLSVLTEIKKLNIQVIRVPASSVMEEVEAYRAESSVEYAEPDYVVRATLTPNDTYYGSQWALPKMRASQSWDLTRSTSATPIAILDSGVDQDHADLRYKITRNANFTTSTTVDDKYGHGTHVAGIAAASTNNGIGIAGVGFDASIMNVKVLSDTGSGYTSWVTNGITWAADNGAKVINMSFGGSSGTASTQSAVDYAWSKGVVLVAAAGNDSSSAPDYPAYYSNVIAVASTDSNDTKSSFSNYGSWVDVAAPGKSIYSTLPNHPYRYTTRNYGYMSGTSMAAPQVAGVAALVWTTSYGTSNASVRDRIVSTANKNTPIYQQYGIARVDAYSAVAGAAPPPPEPPPPEPPPCTAGNPSLTDSRIRAYWANWVDYYYRIVSVDFNIANTGTDTAYGARIVGTVNSPSSVTSTNTPLNVGNIPAGGAASATVRYRLPSGVSSFSSQVYMTASDACGNSYSFPGPYPG